MSYRREMFPKFFKQGSELDNDLNAIGINIACDKPSIDPNIEDTLVAGAIEGVNKSDGRITALLVDWIEIHHERINVHRLTELILALSEKNHHFVKVFWCAIAQRLPTDHRFNKLSKLYTGKRLDFIDRLAGDAYKSTPFLIKKNGEDVRFKNTCIRIPNKTMPHRPHQILSAEIIAKRHMGFRYRVILGPSFRADVWAILRRNPDATAYEVATRAYASYATASQAKRDYEIVRRDYSARVA